MSVKFRLITIGFVRKSLDALIARRCPKCRGLFFDPLCPESDGGLAQCRIGGERIVSAMVWRLVGYFEGAHISTYYSPGPGNEKFHRPSGVAVDESGRIYVADWGNEKVKVFDEDKGLLAELRGESGLSKWSDDYFHANQEELKERGKADMDPALESTQSTPRQQSASVEKLLWGPTSIKFDGDGNVYVVDSCRFRIQVYRWSQD